MHKAEFEQFTVIWLATCELYGKKPSDAAIGLAFRALVRYDLADVRRALDAHINDAGDGRFMPKPADLVKHIEGDPESRSLRAWTLVEESIGRVGPYQTVVFDDPAIMASIEDIGGWIDLCKITDKELPFKRNEFVVRYKGYLNRPPNRHPVKLVGVHEATNSRIEGSSLPDPVLIGNTQKALAVYQSGSTKKRGLTTISEAMKALEQKPE